jgi:hypothetical protein
LVLQKEKEIGNGVFDGDFAGYKVGSYTTLFSSIYLHVKCCKCNKYKLSKIRFTNVFLM